jgi:hypothetical protein
MPPGGHEESAGASKNRFWVVFLPYFAGWPARPILLILHGARISASAIANFNLL